MYVRKFTTTIRQGKKNHSSTKTAIYESKEDYRNGVPPLIVKYENLTPRDSERLYKNLLNATYSSGTK